MTEMINTQALTGAQRIAEVVGISHTTVRKLTKDPLSDIPVSRVGREHRAVRGDLDEWMVEPSDRLVGKVRIAAFIGCSHVTLAAWMRRGDTGVPVRRVGGRVWASKTELAQWIGDADRLTGIPAIAAFIGCSPMAVSRWMWRGDRGLPVRKVGGRIWAQKSELTAWMGGADRVVGLPEIAAALGTRMPVLRHRLRKPDHGLPICRVGGRYSACRADLDALKATGGVVSNFGEVQGTGAGNLARYLR